MDPANKRRTSVIIPSFGPGPVLNQVLTSLRGQTVRPDEVILVHSGPQDIDQLEEDNVNFIRLVRVKQRLFAGAARNLGVNHASGNQLLFVDNDCIPDPDWVEKLCAYEADSASPLILGAVGYHSTGGYWGLVRWLLEFAAIAPYEKTRSVKGHGASANMTVTKKVFDEIGGFDESYRMGQDKKFFLQVVARYGPAGFCSNAVVRHHNTSGFKTNIRHCDRLGYWSARAERQVGRHAGRLRQAATTNPLLAVFVGSWRWCAIAVRVMGWPSPYRILHAWLLPGVAVALIFWTWGFLRGSILAFHGSDAR